MKIVWCLLFCVSWACRDPQPERRGPTLAPYQTARFPEGQAASRRSMSPHGMPVSAARGRLVGRVEKREGLAAPSEAVIFIVVRDVEGRLIGARRYESGLPLDFEIAGEHLMRDLAADMKVVIEARVDQDRDIITESPGDLVGRLGPVRGDAEEVIVTLEERL